MFCIADLWCCQTYVLEEKKPAVDPANSVFSTLVLGRKPSMKGSRFATVKARVLQINRLPTTNLVRFSILENSKFRYSGFCSFVDLSVLVFLSATIFR